MTATPVGDWLRRRYPPNNGATHYLGAGDDPGCCAGPHPACTYDAGFREGARVQREKDTQLAEDRQAFYLVTDCADYECPFLGEPHTHSVAELLRQDGEAPC